MSREEEEIDFETVEEDNDRDNDKESSPPGDSFPDIITSSEVLPKIRAYPCPNNNNNFVGEELNCIDYIKSIYDFHYYYKM